MPINKEMHDIEPLLQGKSGRCVQFKRTAHADK